MGRNSQDDVPISKRNISNANRGQQNPNTQHRYQDYVRNGGKPGFTDDDVVPYNKGGQAGQRGRPQTEARSGKDVYINRKQKSAMDETAYYRAPDNRQRNAYPVRNQNRQQDYAQRPVKNQYERYAGSDIQISGGRQRPVYDEDNAVPAGQGRRKKKPGKIKRFFKGLIAVVLILYIGASAYIYSIVNDISYDKSSHQQNQYISGSELNHSMFVENILLIGVDQRADEASRSDSMILMSIDKKNRKIKLTSFLRDTYVTIPNNGSNRLNAACTFGGAQLVMDTIEYNFKVRIDHYMYVNFEMFKDIINGIGGIDVEITEAEAEYLRDTVKIPYIVAGKNHLNGGAALWYCRIRKLDDDFNRTQRQRKVISSIVSTALKTNPFKLVETVKKVLPNIETDMSPLKMTALIEGAGLFYIHYDIEQAQVPFKDTWRDADIGGNLVLSIDLEENVKKLDDFIYGKNTGK